MFLHRCLGILLLVLLATSLCHSQSAAPPADTPPAAEVPLASNPTGKKQPAKPPALEEKSLGDITPVHALGDIYLAGQPSPEDLQLLKKQGIKTIISVRPPSEVSFDEAAEVKKNGMKFVHLPFKKPEELKPQVFDEVLKVLRDKKSGPTLFHCGSANRVGAIWYAHRVLDGKLSPEDALKEAKVVGLRTPAYLERAQAYVERTKQDRLKAQAKEAPSR